MAVYARALLPRVLVVTAVWIIASGTITFAADKTLVPRTPAKAPVAAPRPILIVPDVRSQAFVFAKGILEDGGFAWRVSGSVRGYATNRVVSQTPAPGTRVVDTGSPTIRLRLAHGSYGQDGTPEDASPYPGTTVLLPTAAKAPAAKAAAKPVAKQAHKRAKVAGAHKARVRKAAKPARAAHPRKLTRRPAAFTVPGAPKEPMNEISLPARAKLLSAWLTPARRPTAPNQRHWLYQHAWIVTGAKFGWWHGADALRILISVDRRVESQWGVGSRSQAVARATLAAVEARAR
jgi:PASTA domain